MVAIAPFRALRYNLARVPDLSAVLAPPYDVIDAEEQERLYQTSPYNVVRLILGKQYPNDTEAENRYTRTGRDFSAWRAGGVLAIDAAPALYLIEHVFSTTGGPATRLGFIALLGLNDATPREVFRHEATLAAPKADRARLMEVVPANLEPIFLIYPDAQGSVQALLERVTHAAAIAEAGMGADRIRLWAITDSSVIESVTRHLASVSVLIADGHHRFEVGYANRRNYGALMAYFVSMKDPALVVWPIHRVATHPAPVDAAALKPWCTVEPAAGQGACAAWLQAAEGPGRFALCDGRQWHRVAVTDQALAQWLMAPNMPLATAPLDVSILHGFLLPKLGVHSPQTAAHNGHATNVVYTAEVAKAAAMANRDARRTAWLLRGIPLEQVYALAAQGMTLSPKSTYFYPKVPSGLAINPFEHGR